MASSSLTKLVFFAYFVLFTFSDKLVAAGESDKVKLNLYYETLCPSCQNFILHYLDKLFDTDLHEIADLKFIPFGNAQLSDDMTVTCQHGEEECKLNAIEACAIRTWPNQRLQYRFIRCVETDTNAWESCLKMYGAEKEINECYFGDLSKELILEYANQTLSLKPEHAYVPWMTLNGNPLYQNIGNFVAQVCKAYKGKTSLPRICNSSALSQRKVPMLQFSYVDKAIKH